MTYHVKEVFYTLQGEGANVGRPAVFCRFTACNLWSGREQDRVTAVCSSATPISSGRTAPAVAPSSDADALADRVDSQWPADAAREAKFVVCTGGEPLLQLDAAAVQALHDRGFKVAVETNGTRPAPPGIDWICVSPKSGAKLVSTSWRRTQARLSSRRSRPAVIRESARFATSFFSPWMAMQPRRTHARRSRTVSLIRPGGLAFRRTSCWVSADGDLPRVHLRGCTSPSART